jgi:hypothetical protein
VIAKTLVIKSHLSYIPDSQKNNHGKQTNK